MKNQGLPSSHTKSREGFTLVELMVVVIVLVILAATIIPQFTGVTYDAKVSMAKAHLSELEGALERFNIHMDRYPTVEEGLRALVDRPEGGGKTWRGPYVKELRRDPWDHEYSYRTRVDKNGTATYDIWSTGMDGADGGEGKNQDISLRQEAKEK